MAPSIFVYLHADNYSRSVNGLKPTPVPNSCLQVQSSTITSAVLEGYPGQWWGDNWKESLRKPELFKWFPRWECTFPLPGIKSFNYIVLHLKYPELFFFGYAVMAVTIWNIGTNEWTSFCPSYHHLQESHETSDIRKHITNTVDGRNPAPPGMYKTSQILRYLPFNWCRISSINSNNIIFLHWFHLAFESCVSLRKVQLQLFTPKRSAALAMRPYNQRISSQTWMELLSWLQFNTCSWPGKGVEHGCELGSFMKVTTSTRLFQVLKSPRSMQAMTYITRRIHVWYLYLHLVYSYGI